MHVTIKDELIEPLEKRAKEKGFKDIETYVNHILEQIAAKVQKQNQVYSKSDEEAIKKRLEDLGYF